MRKTPGGSEEIYQSVIADCGSGGRGGNVMERGEAGGLPL